jgi:hypothetical protein
MSESNNPRPVIPRSSPKGRHFKWTTPEQRAEAARLYAAGMPVEEIASRAGMSMKTVYRGVLEAGIPLRNTGSGLGPRSPVRPVTDDEVREVVRRYEAGESSSVIGAAMGRGRSVIVGTLRRQGIARRGRSESLRGCHRRYTLDEACFESVDTPEKAYALGFIATDGHVNPDSLRIALQRRDVAVLGFFQRLLRSDAPISDCAEAREIKIGGQKSPGEKTYFSSAICFCSRRLAESLCGLGMGGDKTFAVCPWDGPDSLLPYFWAGAVDGDGSVGFKRAAGRRSQGRVRFCGNRQMVDGFREFIRATLGLTATATPHEKIWEVCYGGNRRARLVAGLLYRDTPWALERKRARAMEIISSPPGPADRSRLTLEALERMILVYGRQETAALLNTTPQNVTALLSYRRKRAGK